MDTDSLYLFLDRHLIPYERHEHVEVYTSEQARRLIPTLPGISAKNLFLRTKKDTRYYLLAFPDNKSVNLKSLASVLGLPRLSLASPERLMNILGIEPGAVSILALVNDTGNEVEVLLDHDLWLADQLQCHPLINTETLVIPHQGIVKFLEVTGHKVNLVDIP
jgi:Ala-tRNA(Pro) deacylase